MIARKHVVAIAVGACLLGLSSLSSQKNPVERPFKGCLQGTGVLSPDGTYESNGEGHLTHLGRYTVHGAGFADPSSGVFDVWGVFKAANGDEVWFEMSDPIQAVITGGTGRFTGATGGFMVVEDESELEFGADGTVTVHIKHGIEGTITY